MRLLLGEEIELSLSVAHLDEICHLMMLWVHVSQFVSAPTICKKKEGKRNNTQLEGQARSKAVLSAAQDGSGSDRLDSVLMAALSSLLCCSDCSVFGG